MTKETLNSLKENKDIKFIYKLPCSFYDNKFEYIIIGSKCKVDTKNTRVFSMDEWFQLMKAGSMLPYVCATCSKAGKVKEYINIYEKPDLLALRHYISTIKDDKILLQECLWGEQYIKEGKINRIDVFKNSNPNVKETVIRFYGLVYPRYEMSLKQNNTQ